MATGLLQASNLDQIRFFIHYESFSRLDKADGIIDFSVDFIVPALMDTFIADFQHLKTTYFGQEQYMKLKDGRPVVTLYVTRT